MNRLSLAFTGIGAALGLFTVNRYLFHTESNTEHMYDSASYGLSLLNNRYDIREVPVSAKYSRISLNGTRLRVRRYRIADLGSLAVITANSRMMQMVRFVITPCGVNVPLMSADLMYILGKRKFFIEFYDLVERNDTGNYRDVLKELKKLKRRFDDLPDMSPKKGNDIVPDWAGECCTVMLNKEFTIKNDARGMVMFTSALKTYLQAAKASVPATYEEAEAQRANTGYYVDKLLGDSDVFTAMLKKQFGEEWTKKFFNEVLFRCKER